MGRPGNAYCMNYVDMGGVEGRGGGEERRRGKEGRGGGEGRRRREEERGEGRGGGGRSTFIIKYSTARQDPRHMHSCMRVLSLYGKKFSKV